MKSCWHVNIDKTYLGQAGESCSLDKKEVQNVDPENPQVFQ